MKPPPFKKSMLSDEGKRIVKMLMNHYGMQEDAAMRFIQDGNLSLSMALKQLLNKKAG